MIFAFVEDGTLEVYENLIAAQQAYEGIDVEDGVVHFYDETGTYLEPRFIIPNRRGKMLGIFGWVISGVYELVANPQIEQDTFALALYETKYIEPNPWFTNLEQLKSELSNNGVNAEFSVTKQKEI
jgi:hypothetical protein